MGGFQTFHDITYNYARWYRKDGIFPGKDDDGDNLGIRSIYDMSRADSIPVLIQAIHTLEELDKDLTEEEPQTFEENGASGYWLPTRANAIRPLYQFLTLAKLRPDGLWDGDEAALVRRWQFLFYFFLSAETTVRKDVPYFL